MLSSRQNRRTASKAISLILLAIPLTILAYNQSPQTHAAQFNTQKNDNLNLPQTVDFNRDIKPILSNTCFACHGPDEAAIKADLRLDSFENATLDDVIVPGNPEESILIQRIMLPDNDRDLMPPKKLNKPLTKRQKALLNLWVKQGAKYAKHWSFVQPTFDKLPTTKNKTWAKNPIDNFILKTLENNNLTPSPRANKNTLIRRLSFDLTGLPPSPKQVDKFINDNSPNAYEKLVDSLLASKHYGERWAAIWLDLARYADTKGYEADRRRTIWRYRDYVIDALNADMPFDQFTIEQMAGDLLPNPTLNQKIATAFHRNTMNNDEGGTSDEEFRIAAVADRINTTFSIYTGLTMNCVQCHTHKYDPIQHEEYYQVMAMFNRTEDNDRNDELPLLDSPTIEQAKKLIPLNKKLISAQKIAIKTKKSQEKMLPKWIKSAIKSENSWNHATINNIKSEHNTKFKTLDDHSVITQEKVASKDTYTFQIDLDNKKTHAFMIQTIPHKSLPAGGTGHGGGNFVISQIQAFIDGSDEPIKFKNASASHQDKKHPASATINPENLKHQKNGWAINGKLNTTHHAIFAFEKPIKNVKSITIKIHQKSQYANHTLGRFKIHTSTQKTKPNFNYLPISNLLNKPKEKRTTDDNKKIKAQFLATNQKIINADKTVKDIQDQIKAVGVPTTPVLVQLTEKQMPKMPANFTTQMLQKELNENKYLRRDYIHLRGSYLTPGAIVRPGTLKALHPFPKNTPYNRLTFAKWLMSPKNPITSRVTVNRHWEQFFGTGIVKTSSDFGAQGQYPSHPKLLDWLALELIKQKWSIKKLHKIIVTSATYQQSSNITPDLYKKDQYNRLLARGPRIRLSAEMIRDNALLTSGLLNPQLHGPSVMPKQPEGIWNVVYSGDRWITSKNKQQYRRGLYTFWRRTSPYPSMETFDAPSREFCVVSRQRTNTPLQALVLLSDPVYIEAAQFLARRVLTTSSTNINDRVTNLFMYTLSRKPNKQELITFTNLIKQETQNYKNDTEKAKHFALSGKLKTPKGATIQQYAAWTFAANIILNLDETITKG